MKITVLNKSIKEFKAALAAGIKGIVKASEIYVAALDEDPRVADDFREACKDWVPTAAWSQFEAVGRKLVHPKMLLGGMVDQKKARKVKKLAYSLQDRVFNKERFTLLLASGDTLEVDMLEATPEQVAQLCDDTMIRNLAAQKAWLEQQATIDREAKVHKVPYRIVGGKFQTDRAEYTKAELKQILQLM